MVCIAEDLQKQTIQHGFLFYVLNISSLKYKNNVYKNKGFWKQRHACQFQRVTEEVILMPLTKERVSLLPSVKHCGSSVFRQDPDKKKRNFRCLHCDAVGIKRLTFRNTKGYKAGFFFHPLYIKLITWEEISLSTAASHNKLPSLYMLLSALIHLMRHEYINIYMYIQHWNS